MKRRSAWEGERKESWRLKSIFDPHFVDGMPSNEERLRHLDYYLREHDVAPIVSGVKKGNSSSRLREDERVWMEEHDVHLEFNTNEEGIRKVGV